MQRGVTDARSCDPSHLIAIECGGVHSGFLICNISNKLFVKISAAVKPMATLVHLYTRRVIKRLPIHE